MLPKTKAAALLSIPWGCYYGAYALLSVASLGLAFRFVLGYCGAGWGVSEAVGPLLLLVMLLAFFVVLLLAWREKPERVFLLIGTPALAFFSLFMLPDYVPDEIFHIWRAFDLRLTGPEVSAPLSLAPYYRNEVDLPSNYAMLYEAMVVPADWDQVRTFDFTRDVTNYLPHLYIFPTLVSEACRLLWVNPFVTIICARFANAALFAVAGYWVIRILPLGRVVAFVYLLNPMLIQQEASCSADAVTNIACLLFVAFLIKVRFASEVKRSSIVLMVVLFCFVCLSKYAYALLAFLFLLFVPKLKSRRVRVAIYACVSVAFVAALLYVVLWYDGSAYRPTIELLRDGPEFASVMLKTLYEIGPVWVEEFGGGILGALNIPAWEPCFWLYMVLLLFSPVFGLGEDHAFNRAEKVYMCLCSLFVTIAIILSFRGWTISWDKRWDVLMGAQGRYFIPYAILPLLCAITPQSSLCRRNSLLVYGGLICLVFVIDAMFVVRTFL